MAFIISISSKTLFEGTLKVDNKIYPLKPPNSSQPPRDRTPPIQHANSVPPRVSLLK